MTLISVFQVLCRFGYFCCCLFVCFCVTLVFWGIWDSLCGINIANYFFHIVNYFITAMPFRRKKVAVQGLLLLQLCLPLDDSVNHKISNIWEPKLTPTFLIVHMKN